MHPVARVSHVVEVCTNAVHFYLLVPVLILLLFEVLFRDERFVVHFLFRILSFVLATQAIAVVVRVRVVPAADRRGGERGTGRREGYSNVECWRRWWWW